MNSDSRLQGTTPLFVELIDENRLKLIKHLSEQDLSADELSDLTGMHPKAIQHNLEMLESAQVVNSHLLDGVEIYRFNQEYLEEFNHLLVAQQEKNKVIDSLGLPKDKQRIVTDYTYMDGSLRSIPTKMKKITPVLDYLSTSFELDIEYSEPQVNEILEKYYPDTTTLRRYLVDYGYLGRAKNGAQYWKTEPHGSNPRN